VLLPGGEAVIPSGESYRRRNAGYEDARYAEAFRPARTARHVKQCPGRKTDVKDAQWLCQLLEAGLLKPSFVPPKPIRTLRNLTRYRKAQINDRQRESSRLHKILEDTGIKLGCVATDILGKSRRDMLDALVTGTTDPTVLAELARGKLRAKIPALEEALEGRFDSEHALIVSQILAHLDFLGGAIDRLSAEIEERIAPFARERDLLMTIPGVKQRTAEVLISASVARSHFEPLLLLPRRPIPALTRSPRPIQSPHRCRTLDPHRRLAHAPNRRAIQRPRSATRNLCPGNPAITKDCRRWLKKSA
jgi:Transposase